MRFSCTQENFNQGLTVVSHVASKNVNLPILNNVLLKTEEGGIRLLATNLEIGISCFIRGKVEEQGEFTIPARVLADYINLLPSQKIDVSLKENYLDINCDNYQTKIKGEPASEFPLVPQIKREKPLVAKVGDLVKALQQVIFAVSLSESRPELSGVLLDFIVEKGKLIIAATDSYRLAEKNLKVAGREDGVRTIIPANTLQELQRILGSASKNQLLADNESKAENVEIYLGENQILFVYNNIELVSRVIEGQYPDYSQIIPQNYQTQVVIGTDDLIKAVKSSSLFVKTGINDVLLEFNPSNEVVVSSVNTQLGENQSVLTANITGPKNSAVLNYRYLLDGLQALGTPEVILEVIDNNTPIILKPVLTSAEAGVDRDYLYLVMPIKQ
ncbi:MAG: DNA polymerase III subunit beta [Patescibacteria group bacterium]